MRVLITAGPTREYFDSVRFISNPSSGKMGYAIAAEAASRGHDVVLISGPIDLDPPTGVALTRVVSAAEMCACAKDAFDRCDAAIMTAAVCDYRPARRLSRKLRKQSQPRNIDLLPTEDICAHLGRIKGDRVVIGFAMEDHDHHRRAAAKLRKKNCDAIVLNGIGNVGTDDATVEILRAGGDWSQPVSGEKQTIAGTIVRLVESLVTGST